MNTSWLVILLFSLLLIGPWATAGSADQPARSEDGKYFDAEGNPTYHIAADGTVDWYTYSGFRRYHSECHVCHGPDGLGGSFAPGLVQPMKTMSYGDFLNVVVNGRETISTSAQRKMPAFGYNKNVMCFIDDLYVYLKARADGALGRDRPPKQEPKSDAARAAEKACFGA
jgi:methanol metabolism-related c-type cytochrome